MPRSLLPFVLAALLAASFSDCRPFHCRALAAEDSATGTTTYSRAIEEAEQALRDLDGSEQAKNKGWALADFLALAALVAAIGLVLWASRWSRRLFFRQAPGREMRILDRMSIGKNSTLLLVKMRGKVYWLADHPSGVTRLDDWPEGEAPASVSELTAEQGERIALPQEAGDPAEKR